jgi:glycosyltransferase involved in cell wall biosynthesis
MMPKPSIAIIIDVNDWAFERISEQLFRRYQHQYDVEVLTLAESQIKPKVKHYDLLVSLWWAAVHQIRHKRKVTADKYVTAIYDHFTWKNNRFLTSQNLNSSDGIVVCNARMAQELKSFAPDCLNGKPVWVCEDGVDTNRFQPAPFPPEFTVAWAGNSQAARDNLKGLDLVQKACLALQIPLLLADRHSTGLPFDQMPAFFSGATVGCFPSRSEGTPNPLLEMLAMGRRVAITNVGLAPEVIREGRTGTIIEHRTVDSVADALKRLMEMDPNGSAERCRKVALAYSWERKIRDWQPVFDHFIGKV